MFLMTIGTLSASVGYGLRDYTDQRRDSVGPMTVYALVFGVWCGLAHLVGVMLMGTTYDWLFFYVGERRYPLEAQTLASMNVVIPLLAYDIVRSGFARGGAFNGLLPSAALSPGRRPVVVTLCALLGLDWAMELTGSSLGLSGTPRATIAAGTLMYVFVVTGDWLSPVRRLPGWMAKSLLIVVPLATWHALLFSYLRINMALPIFAVFLAVLTRKAFTKKLLVAGLVSLVVVAIAYRVLFDIRSTGAVGQERVAMIVSGSADASSEVAETALLLVARAGQFHSLSHVIDLTEQQGFYNGETLGYVVYAFIPRLIWPDKPLIAPGQWFAEQTGHGTAREGGGFNNAVNMTLAGEFYLNFGWMGAIAGLSLLALIYAAIWPTTGDRGDSRNVTGQILAASILLQAIGSGFASAILQLIFTYLTLLAIKWVARSLFRLKHEGARTAAIPTTRPLRRRPGLAANSRAVRHL